MRNGRHWIRSNMVRNLTIRRPTNSKSRKPEITSLSRSIVISLCLLCLSYLVPTMQQIMKVFRYQRGNHQFFPREKQIATQSTILREMIWREIPKWITAGCILYLICGIDTKRLDQLTMPYYIAMCVEIGILVCGCLTDIVGLWMLHSEGIEIFGRIYGAGVREVSVPLSQSSLTSPSSVNLQLRPLSPPGDSRMSFLSSSSVLSSSSTVVDQSSLNADFKVGNKDLEK